MKRTAFFVSDGTGITAESIGNSLLAQFENIDFETITVPYIDNVEKARALVRRINEATQRDGARAVIFDTLVDKAIREELASSNAFLVDIFGTFVAQLENEFSSKSTLKVGKSHSIQSNDKYERRIDAVNFALDNDDGARTRQYSEADVILVGVSRSGKTPTCLYLALQYGIRAANYPITEEDLNDQQLPAQLKQYREKLFGLTIDVERLAAIRNERKPNSRYSSISQCMHEVEEVELMYRRERIPFLDTTHYSVEEIATRIMVISGIERRTNG